MEQDLYQELIDKKNKGEELDWNNIKKEELEELFRNHSNNAIAELYGVSGYKFKKQREKWNIKQYNYAIEAAFKEFFSDENNRILYENSNIISKERLLSEDNRDFIPIALTHYLFRNGPVEDMHADGKLSQDDMKTLNKFMVNRIAGLLQVINNGEWLKLELLLNYYRNFGTNWDKPIPDTEEIDLNYSDLMNKL